MFQRFRGYTVKTEIIGHHARTRVPNSPTGQVLEAGPDWPLLVDVDDVARLTWVVRSGLD